MQAKKTLLKLEATETSGHCHTEALALPSGFPKEHLKPRTLLKLKQLNMATTCLTASEASRSNVEGLPGSIFAA